MFPSPAAFGNEIATSLIVLAFVARTVGRSYCLSDQLYMARKTQRTERLSDDRPTTRMDGMNGPRQAALTMDPSQKLRRQSLLVGFGHLAA